MVIANTNTKSVFNANGVTREWPIDFVINQDVSKINILLEDASGEQTEVTTGYSLENNVVTYPTLESGLAPVAEGNKVIIFRTTQLTQEKDLADNIVESGLDKLTLQVQEISEQVGRAIKVPISEDGLSQYKNPITEIREETKKSLDEIKAATDVVSSYTTESATNAATSKEEADRAVEASNISVMASSDAEAAAVMAENLSNEAKDAVSAYVNGLGSMRNSVIDLGLFESNQRRASSCIIDFDYEPLDVFIRFSDSERKMWIKGSHSFAGFEKIGDKKYKIFYSVSSEDFASQSAIKGPFYVQYVIKYSVFSGHPVTYRGRVDTVDQLPETAEDGDLWYVGPIEQSNKEEYIWQDGKWELLGSTDFSSVYSKEEIDNKVSVIENSIDSNADAIQKTRDDFTIADTNLQNQITALNFVKWVDTLPETGEIKYIYAVPREETDTDGKQIAALYLWDGSAWRGAGAFSLNIDPDTLATKAELAGYLPLRGGTLSGEFAVSNAQSKFGTQLNGWKFYFICKKGNYPSLFLGNDELLSKKWTSITRINSGRLNIGFSSDTSEKKLSVNGSTVLLELDKAVANGVASLDENAKVPTEQIPVATTSTLGGVKPDGETITVTEDGTISAVGGSGSGDTIGLSIGDVVYSYSSLSSENPGKLPLFTGETIASANTIYPEFYNWVSAHTELQCTAEEYESALSTYGECAKYVIGGGSLRLPLIKNYIKAANTSEGIKNIEAGLPNITGQTGVNTTGGNGVFSNTIESIKGTVAISGYNTTTVTSNFDASRSSAVYGKSSTVTPASTTLYPWVVAYTAAIPASTAAAAEFQNALSGKLDLPSGKTQADVDFVVESYHGEDGNWYRKYKSGWVEQGGYGKGNITFLKPYSSLPNVITGSANKTGDGWPARANEVTSTGFYLYGGNQDTVSAYWEAKGQGAN